MPLVDRDQRGQLGLTCPTCRQVTPTPDRGVAGLQPAFHINNLLEIQDSVKKLDNPTPPLAGGIVVAGKHCFEHPEEKLKLYCKTCGDVICLKCAIKSGKHHSHDYQELDQAFQQYKEDITSSVEPMEKQVAIMEGVLAQVDMRCGDIFDQQTTTEVNIHATFTQLRHFLDVWETGLISKLHKITHNKLKHLAVQREQIKTILVAVFSS